MSTYRSSHSSTTWNCYGRSSVDCCSRPSLRPSRGAQYCDGPVCRFVCLSAHMSGTTRPNFTKFSVHVACGGNSVLVWQRYNTLCTFVLWMTSCFHVPLWRRSASAATSQQCRRRRRGIGCVLFYRRQRSPRLDESFRSGVGGEQFATHHCLAVFEILRFYCASELCRGRYLFCPTVRPSVCPPFLSVIAFLITMYAIL